MSDSLLGHVTLKQKKSSESKDFIQSTADLSNNTQSPWKEPTKGAISYRYNPPGSRHKMNARLAILILIGIIASAITLYFNNTNSSGTLPNPLISSQTDRNKTSKSKDLPLQNENIPSKKNYAATPRNEARLLSQIDKGRPDPFAPLVNPHRDSILSNKNTISKSELPPPPDLDGQGSGLLPPPPAMSEIGASLPPEPNPTISIDELPYPPENQSLSQKLKLNAVLGDKVILAFSDRSYASANGFRNFVTLGRGDKFESIRLVDIENNMAVIEENGQTSELKLPDIH